MKKKSAAFIILSILLSLIFSYEPLSPSPPSIIGFSPSLYSTQAGDYLEDTLVSSLRKAKKSITLVIYSLKDGKIIQTLNDKAKEGILVKVIYDAKASSGLHKKLNHEIQKIPKASKGLMHLKLLILDDESVWLGSANMTQESLKKQANLIAHVASTHFAQAVSEKANQLCQIGWVKPIKPKQFQIGNQNIELRFLPDDKEALYRLKELIGSAQKTIKVAMYTFTRLDIAKDLIVASKKGVKVSVVIDKSSSKGASAKVVDYLIKNDIKPVISQGEDLMHNKFIWIDDHILAHGSANWTKAAFNQNDDYIMIINNLNDNQKNVLKSLWGSFEKS